MEKVNDILKSIIGVLIVLSFVMAFSSCEKKTETNNNQDTLKQNSSGTKQEVKEDISDWRAKAKEESKEIEAKLEVLKEKAKSKSGKAKEDINQQIDKLNQERKDLVSDSTGDQAKEKWEKFKDKVKNAADSLDKKI
ncbi:MAG: hypothetical protein K2X86_07580 [Cytophagaceae bacterium]|nr:hypothetical protein [Cytophagaceae bacterium]